MTSLNSEPQSDFTKMSSGEIFNNTVVAVLNDLDANAKRIDAIRGSQMDEIFSNSEQISDLVSATAQPAFDPGVVEEEVDYNAPVVPSPFVVPTAQGAQNGPESLKLSNYGYASDSSPDYNSNVRRVGHAENRLEDGVSAALTKSLAKRYGLKTGDMFEITTDKGVMKRRYDDTVPTTYKGKPLPETIDLYELKGSNKFGGKVTSIKKL